jgi:hypothetical protein
MVVLMRVRKNKESWGKAKMYTVNLLKMGRDDVYVNVKFGKLITVEAGDKLKKMN